MKRIAILGSAPSSVALTPFHDPSWEIWACSPGSVPHLKRCDRFFELHRWEPDKPWFHKDYITWMAGRQHPVYMIQPVPEIPASVAYPKDHVMQYIWGWKLEEDGTKSPLMFDPNTFTSSIAWMLALAISQKPDEIGIWGVDMAAQEEYGPQKDGCLAMIHIARQCGIRIATPPESDLIRPAIPYGYREVDHMFIKLQTRVNELEAQLAKAEADFQEADRRRWFFKGALDDAMYVKQTWPADPNQLAYLYGHMNMAVQAKPPLMDAIQAAEAEVKPGEIAPVIKQGERRKAKRTGVNGAHGEKAPH